MIYVYRFALYSKPRGGVLVQSWTHTSYEKPVTVDALGGLTFVPLRGLTHSDVRYDSEKNAGQLRVTVPRDFAVAAMFLGGYPYGSVHVTVWELDSDAPNATYATVWQGRVRSCKHEKVTAELTCTNGSEMLQRLGLRLNGGAGCQWDLGSPQCGVNEAVYTRAGSVTGISPDGLEVTTTLGEADDWFKAGKFRARGQVRMVLKNAGGTLSLMSPIPGLTVGDAIEATKGCDHTASATSGCRSFNNYANYSGFEGFITPKNIFSEGV